MKIKKLSDVCNFYSGTGFPVKYQGNDSGDYPFYKVGDIANNVNAGNIYLDFCNNYVCDEIIVEIKGSVIPKDTVVFAKIGEALKLNRRAITSSECLIDNNAMGIAPKKNYLDIEYFFFFMKNLKMEKLAESTTVPSVRKSKLENVSVSFPTIEEQKLISSKLKKILLVIDKRIKQIELLDNLIKSRFVEMFDLFQTNKFKYEIVKLNDVCSKITDGKHGGCTLTIGTNRYFIGAREIYNDQVNYDDAIEIDVKEFEKDYKRCNVEIGDFLIVNTGATIGKSAIAIDNRTVNTLLQKSVALLKNNKERLNVFYLKYCYELHPQMYLVHSSSAQPNLLLSKIRDTKILIPPIELQNEFADFVKQVDKSKFAIQQSLDEMQVLYDSLMQEYFG